MPSWSTGEVDALASWMEVLAGYDVFFSAPLDLDFLLLEAFPVQYKAATIGTGPRLPSTALEMAKRLKAARMAVLKPEGGDGSTYSNAQRDLFIWYQYSFWEEASRSLTCAHWPRLMTKSLPRACQRSFSAYSRDAGN